jgi:2-oxoacid:acceptor oxidoreductase gamma subunit (pyruvate/2-ketoisovalerate family)
MYEIRFHGRGGQGAVTAANILAVAAFKENKFVQSFPMFGVERRGAPVTAYVRLDSKPIRIKFQIYEPDHVVVLDQALFFTTNITQGLRANGLVLVNTNRSLEMLQAKLAEKSFRIATIDATQIALRHNLGSRTAPIVNTAMVGAFAKVSGIVKISSVTEAILELVPGRKEDNVKASEEAYDKVILPEKI